MSRSASQWLWLYVTGIVVACVAVPRITCAQACKPARACTPRFVLPASGGRMPANMVELVWSAQTDVPYTLTSIEPGALPTEILGEANVHLAGRTVVPISVVHVRPTNRLEPGVVLRFSHPEDCLDDPSVGSVTTSFTITDAAPVPRRLGKLRVQSRIGSFTVGGAAARSECTDEIETGYADIRIELAAEAQPYEDQWMYQLLVDGRWQARYDDQVYNGGRVRPVWESALGRGRERIFAACHGELEQAAMMEPLATAYREIYPFLEPGVHEVKMVGFLPDGTEVESERVELVLSCPGDDEGEPAADGGGCSVGRKGGPAGWMLVLGMLGLIWRRTITSPRSENSPASSQSTA